MLLQNKVIINHWQSEELVFNLTLSIKGITFEYRDKDHNGIRNEGNTNMYFHSHFSDDSDQNAATTYEHMKNFIHWMYEENLFINNGIIY